MTFSIEGYVGVRREDTDSNVTNCYWCLPFKQDLHDRDIEFTSNVRLLFNEGSRSPPFGMKEGL